MTGNINTTSDLSRKGENTYCYLIDKQTITAISSLLNEDWFNLQQGGYKGGKLEIQALTLSGKRIFFHTFRLKEKATTLLVYPETILQHGICLFTVNLSTKTLH